MAVTETISPLFSKLNNPSICCSRTVSVPVSSNLRYEAPFSLTARISERACPAIPVTSSPVVLSLSLKSPSKANPLIPFTDPAATERSMSAAIPFSLICIRPEPVSVMMLLLPTFSSRALISAATLILEPLFSKSNVPSMIWPYAVMSPAKCTRKYLSPSSLTVNGSGRSTPPICVWVCPVVFILSVKIPDIDTWSMAEFVSRVSSMSAKTPSVPTCMAPLVMENRARLF